MSKEEEKKGKTILLVDDDEFLIDMYKTKFEQSGCTVEPATGGDEALQKLRDGFTPDIILLDMVMPKTDGLAVLTAIKEEGLGDDPLIIVLSNQNEEIDIKHAKEAGAHRYLVKASAVPSRILDNVFEIAKEHGLD